MMLTLDEAKDCLRVDGTDNDALILSLLQAVPDYLEATTGIDPRTHYSPLALTAARFILWLWYYGESADAPKIQRVIDSLLKALSAERFKYE